MNEPDLNMMKCLPLCWKYKDSSHLLNVHIEVSKDDFVNKVEMHNPALVCTEEELGMERGIVEFRFSDSNGLFSNISNKFDFWRQLRDLKRLFKFFARDS